VLTLVLPTGQTDRGKLIGNTIVDSQGWVWEKPADAPKAPAVALTIDQIVQMIGAKIPDDIVIMSIEKSGAKFDLTPEDLIKLKAAGANEAVLRAMMK
jgi:hypothetical protein